MNKIISHTAEELNNPVFDEEHIIWLLNETYETLKADSKRRSYSRFLYYPYTRWAEHLCLNKNSKNKPLHETDIDMFNYWKDHLNTNGFIVNAFRNIDQDSYIMEITW